jgi:hypothetical protein
MPRRKKTEKNKLEELNQTHAKNETNNPTTLDQVWGDEGLGKYKTLNRDKYKTYLDELNKSDMQRHASQVGIVPIDSREMLVSRLMKEFDKHVASYNMPSPNTNPTANISDAAKRILSEGR